MRQNGSTNAPVGNTQTPQSRMRKGAKKRFKTEYPKKFTKTDLAKFENVWDEEPFWVNLGAQKNFIQYMERISEAWEKSRDQFNEDYYRRIVARAVVFKATDRMVFQQDWYRNQPGYKANIVPYTLAAANALSNNRNRILDYQRIWKDHRIEDSFLDQLALIAKYVRDVLYLDTRPIPNCSEWAKKKEFWGCLEQDFPEMRRKLTSDFWHYFVPD